MQFHRCLLAALIPLTALAVGAPAAADAQPQPRLVTCTWIKTAHQLQAMRNNIAGHYCLANDIDAGTIANFKPIGTAANRFTGRLFGNNRVIRNLTINNPGADVGMFGSTDGAVIRDLALVNVNVTGPNNAYVGGLVGTAYADSGASTIVRVSVTGLVTSPGASSVGGIVGLLNDNVFLKESRSSAKIVGAHPNTEVGGLVAKNRGTIQRCYATGAITGPSTDGNAGGLVGTSDPVSSVQWSYAAGTVTAGDATVGGLVGQQNGGTVTEGYAVGKVTGAGANVGGLIGAITGSPIVMDSYWDTQTSGQGTSGGDLGGGLLTTQFRAELPPGFSNAWAITETLSYPFLDDPDLDFASPLATLVRASKVFVFEPIDQLDPAQYLTAPMHADEASLAAVYTMIARAVGITNNDGRLDDVKIDRYFWNDATRTATWTGPVKDYATRGTLVSIASGTPMDSTNVIDRMSKQRLVILRGTYRKSDGSAATHWMLGTLYTPGEGGIANTVVVNDPVTGSQIELDLDSKRVLTPGFPLANFKVNGYQPVSVH